MIEFATVVPGSETPAGDGVTGARRCVLTIKNGRPVSAVIKRGPLKEVLAESFCAVLLTGWGLPVPTPYLVLEQTSLAFASADSSYPNLKHRFNIDVYTPGTPMWERAVRLAETIVCSLQTAPLAAVADEAIDNRDRNLGNVLWDGADEAWIDHAYALGNAPHLADANKLCNMAMDVQQTAPMAKSAIAQWTMLDRNQPAQAAAAMAPHMDATPWQVLVESRVATLGQRLLARFPKPADLLSNV